MKSASQDNFPIKSNFTVILIIAISFFAGYLWAKVQMSDKLGAGGQQLGAQTKSVSDLAKNIGLDTAKFKQCLDSGKYKAKIQQQADGGAAGGVGATPTSVVYDMKTGKSALIEGAYPFDQAKSIIDNFISGIEPTLGPSVTPPPEIKITRPSRQNDHWQGPVNPKYVMVEYSDLECPYCQKFHPTAKQLMSQYGGQMAWVYRHFPLPIHPKAPKLAEATECAFEQKGNDGFWNMTDKIFESMPDLATN